MRKVIPLLLILAFLRMPAIAQQVIIEDEPVDPTRVLVFLPDRDIPPPYEVTGEVIDGVATIYINGIQIIPNPWRARGRRLPQGNLDRYSSAFVDIQCDMQEIGCTLDEITEAFIEYMNECPGVVNIERNKHDLYIHFEDGSTVESWVRFISCDMQKNVNWRVERFERLLEKGYAQVFIGDDYLSVYPEKYDSLVAEINQARHGLSESQDREWKILKSEMAKHIRKLSGGLK